MFNHKTLTFICLYEVVMHKFTLYNKYCIFIALTKCSHIKLYDKSVKNQLVKQPSLPCQCSQSKHCKLIFP